VLNLASRLTADRYLTNLQFVQNAVDWSVEDLDLLAIRAHGSTSRILQPMTEQQQSLWESANYVIALVALVVIFFAWRARKRRPEPVTQPDLRGGLSK
jgi:ABC-2 type transport system permease protein